MIGGAVFGAGTRLLPAKSGIERERERERCVSSADASTYGTRWAHDDPHHICPCRTHAKTTLLHVTRPSPQRPLQALAIDLRDQPKPSLFRALFVKVTSLITIYTND